jgi:hypothetical protein
LKIDFKNAFNMVDRESFILLCIENFPEMARWVSYCYTTASYLFLRDNVIWSQSGVQQGDPLGPLLFSIVLNQLTDKIQLSCPILLLNKWFCDDGTMIGSREEVVKALNIIIEEGESLGLILNLNKCEIHWPSGDQSFPLFPGDIKRLPKEGVCLLGSAIGTSLFVGDFMDLAINDCKKFHILISSIEDPHIETTLLRYCGSFSKLAYKLRTINPEFTENPCLDFDASMKDCLEEITRCQIPGKAWIQASLPIRFGGIGLQLTYDHSCASYLGSRLDSYRLCCDIQGKECVYKDLLLSKGAKFAWDRLQSLDSFFGIPIENFIGGRAQKSLSELVTQDILKGFNEGMGRREKTFYESLTMDHAGEWLSAQPNPNFNLHMRSDLFRLSLRRRLSLKIYKAGGKCPNCKKVILDVFGDHALSCGYGSGRFGRHSAICSIVTYAANSVDLRAVREPSHTFLNSGLRADWEMHEVPHYPLPVLGDVSVVSPVLFSHLSSLESTKGIAALEGENTKKEKYVSLCEENDFSFIPFIIESSGGFGKEAIALINVLVKMQAAKTSKSIALCKKYFFQKLSVSLQRNNASMLNACLSISD